MYKKGDWCRWHRETGDAAVLNGRITRVLDDGDWYTIGDDPTPRKAWATTSRVKGEAFSAFEGDLIVVSRRPRPLSVDVSWDRRLEMLRSGPGPSIDELIKGGHLPKPTLWQRVRHFFKG